MTKKCKIILRIVGVTTCIVALAGFAYTISYIVALYGEPELNKYEHFNTAYYSMVAICSFFYSILLWFGYSFIKLRAKYWYIYALVFILEYFYFRIVGRLWVVEDETWAMSIAAATGVANGGLVLQAFSGIFIWGPILVIYTWFKCGENDSANNIIQPTPKSGAAD